MGNLWKYYLYDQHLDIQRYIQSTECAWSVGRQKTNKSYKWRIMRHGADPMKRFLFLQRSFGTTLPAVARRRWRIETPVRSWCYACWRSISSSTCSWTYPASWVAAATSTAVMTLVLLISSIAAACASDPASTSWSDRSEVDVDSISIPRAAAILKSKSLDHDRIKFLEIYKFPVFTKLPVLKHQQTSAWIYIEHLWISKVLIRSLSRIREDKNNQKRKQ